MYQEFFGLKEPPFNLTPDPRFLYMSRRHRDALASLVYGIKEGKGFIALTGEIGSGKTTLCRAFLGELNSETTHVALILNSYLSDVELLQAINDELHLPAASTSKKELIDHLNKFLLEENARDKTTILIVDEAQNLKVEVLEQIRMLSNLETERTKLIQIVLIGQPELAGILARPELEQLNQRITVRCHIGPLNRDEIYHYVRHRLHVAGAELSISLTPTAINRIFHFSGGVPRKINLLCDRALLAAYVAGVLQIDAKIVARAQQDLGALAETASGPRRVFATPGWRAARIGAGAVFVLACLSVLFWIGIRIGRLPLGGSGGDIERGPALAGKTQAVGELTSGTAQQASAQPLAAAVPPPGAVEVRPSKGLQWYYDGNDVVRVDDPEYARTASLLSLAKRWRFPVSLEDFRARDKQTILQLDVLGIFSEKVGLRHMTVTEGLDTFLPVGMPLMLKLDVANDEMSRYVVLESVSGAVCRVSDPRVGAVEISLEDLKSLVRETTLLYLDPDNLASLSPGDNAPAVAKVQRYLIDEKFAKGQPSPIFDVSMVDALRAYQARWGLPVTGRLDGRTAALMAAAWQTSETPHLKP